MSKKRVDTAFNLTEIMKDAIKGIQPPAHIKLLDRDMPFWKSIIDARAEWTEVDLVHAANLARCQSDIEYNQDLLRTEGEVLLNERGTPVMNPRFTILEQLSRRSVSLSSKIQVHAGATMGEAKQAKGKNTAKRNALNSLAIEEDEDSLIARPN